MTDLDNIETVKPNIDVITKYNKIMSEPEGAIVVSNVKGLESLEKIDEEVAKKGEYFQKVIYMQSLKKFLQIKIEITL
ncbi:hypothetical protein [Marinitoga lauensis]|uniref:hypothetical protein n=1 Tax=Marinitoga lauensis TaxID=2201189 RepID=UPI001011E9D5|nr:hypothetical protein [Marinitoga lauensis]